MDWLSGARFANSRGEDQVATERGQTAVGWQSGGTFGGGTLSRRQKLEFIVNGLIYLMCL